MWLRTFLWLFAILLCISVESSEVSILSCPSGCRCFTTAEGLHKASCFSTLDLKKFSQNNKHHNINILDLSHSSISKINNDLDKFAEVVSLDLSHNSIKDLKKLLPNSKKLVHLNIENNLLKTFSASSLPISVSSLNLKNNLLENVPSDLHLLKDLEHLELKGNPIYCSCENIKTFHKLLNNHVVTDDAKCASPPNRKGKKLSVFKLSEVCSKDEEVNKFVPEPLEDMMFGDEASDIDIFGPISDQKSMEANEDINLVKETWEANKNLKDDDEKEYLRVGETTTVSGNEFDTEFEGSGSNDLFLPYDKITLSNDTDDMGSGDHGSGFPLKSFDFEGSGDEDEENVTTTTEMFLTGPIEPFGFGFGFDHNDSTTEMVEMPKIFQGTPDWDNKNKVETTTEGASSESPVVEVPIKKVHNELQETPEKKSEEIVLSEPEAAKEPVKTTLGTYICIGIIVVLLVGLIGFSVIKGRIRKNRNRMQIRQQKRDVEKGGKELVDMNKSLLGKPISQQLLDDEKDRKMNGNYELVPTHETFKKPENGKSVQSPEKEKQIPVNENVKPEKTEPLQNGNRKSNTIPPEMQPVISITPTKSEPDGQNLSPNLYSDNNFAYPPEYNPVYNHDMGRVKIKLTETPKPKTPVLITRSRSNAGDIIITPAEDQTLPVSNST